MQPINQVAMPRFRILVTSCSVPPLPSIGFGGSSRHFHVVREVLALCYGTVWLTSTKPLTLPRQNIARFGGDDVIVTAHLLRLHVTSSGPYWWYFSKGFLISICCQYHQHGRHVFVFWFSWECLRSKNVFLFNVVCCSAGYLCSLVQSGTFVGDISSYWPPTNSHKALQCHHH